MINRIFYKLTILFVLSNTVLFGNSSINNTSSVNDLYIFPNQAKAAKDRILDLIEKSEDTIHIAMYNFSYKKIAKKLVKAVKRGVEIIVIFDKSKVKKDDKIYEYLKENNIKVLIAKKKLHTKVAIFDKNIIVLGSSNWTKESFKENHEIILFSSDKKIIRQTIKFLENLQ